MPRFLIALVQWCTMFFVDLLNRGSKLIASCFIRTGQRLQKQHSYTPMEPIHLRCGLDTSFALIFRNWVWYKFSITHSVIMTFDSIVIQWSIRFPPECHVCYLSFHYIKQRHLFNNGHSVASQLMPGRGPTIWVQNIIIKLGTNVPIQQPKIQKKGHVFFIYNLPNLDLMDKLNTIMELFQLLLKPN